MDKRAVVYEFVEWKWLKIYDFLIQVFDLLISDQSQHEQIKYLFD